MIYTRAQLNQLRADNKKWPADPREILQANWPQFPTIGLSVLLRVWRSCDFLVMLYVEPSQFRRLTFQRTDYDNAGRALQNISWDDIQQLKEQCGYADFWAVEVYPPPKDVVNVQNMRHIFLLDEPPPYAWRKK